MLAHPEMHEKEDEAHGDGGRQTPLSETSWLTQQWDRETRLYPGTEAILNCYVHVNTNALTVSPFHLQQCPSKELEGLYLTFTSPDVPGAQQCLLVDCRGSRPLDAMFHR